MALHCTVLRARELFVLRMRTLAIQYPDPWGKSAIPNKENSPPCPGWRGVEANIDRSIKQLPTSTTDDIEARICWYYGFEHDNIAVELVELYVQ